MTNTEIDVLVVGAGICGLTTALTLARAGLRVAVEAAEPPELTTSARAGAIWGLHRVGLDERGAGWALTTLSRMRELTATPEARIRLVSGTEAHACEQPDPPGFAAELGGAERADPAALPAGFTDGWRYTAPVAWMPGYLGYLAGLLRQSGVPVADPVRPFGSLAEIAAQSPAPVIVNCTGLGSRDLVPDPTMVPVRGQLIVATNPGITEFFIGYGPQPGTLTYLFPHEGTVVLGGTEQAGDWNTETDAGTAADIMQRCAAVEPRLIAATVLANRAGLRPVRPLVRLEGESVGDRYIVHNYGHGGAGVTLSWGCAEEVTGLVRRHLAG